MVQSKIEAPAISSNSRDFLFVVLTCVAGNVYALSVFGLGMFIGGPVSCVRFLHEGSGRFYSSIIVHTDSMGYLI
jgi:hypothetical protein